MHKAILTVLILATVGSGQHWEFEQVDSAGWGGGVRMAYHPDGRLVLCYAHGTDGTARLAWRDSACSYTYDSIPVDYPSSQALSFCLAPDGRIGFGLAGLSRQLLMVRADSGWVQCSIPTYWSVQPDFGKFPSAFDSTGAPVVLVDYACQMWLLQWEGDSWVAGDPIDGAPFGVTVPVDLGVKHDGRLWGMHVAWAQGIGYDWVRMVAFEWQDEWVVTVLGGGDFARMNGPSAALDLAGYAHHCWWGNGEECHNGFAYDGQVLDSAHVPKSELAFDSYGRPLVVYLDNGDLRFCYRDSRGWHHYLVETGVGNVDVLAGTDGQPWIAYNTTQGVFLARGVDITGVQEMPNGELRMPNATIVRGVLRVSEASGVGRGASCVLLDITGRRVMDLVPGENDVSRIAPGVYFVVAEQDRAVSKVILQR